MEKNWNLIREYLIKFLQNEVYRTGLENVVIGLSGGIDSAVVAKLAKDAFEDGVYSILMPSQFSSKESISDAKELCEKFNIEYQIVSIEPMLNSYFRDYSDRLRVGNFSARVRMSILYDISAQRGALVVGTSNKSELLLGYGTLFGDLASALNPIGDLYKSEIFEFAKFLKIPDSILNKPPSADLWEGQSDEDELGFKYSEIDNFLKLYIDERFSIESIKEMGVKEELIEFALNRIYKNQFKRKMPLIAKLTNRTINSDFLYPRDIKL